MGNLQRLIDRATGVFARVARTFGRIHTMDPAQLEGWVSDIEAAEVKFIVGYMLSCFIHLLALLCLLTLNLSMFHQYEFFLRINISRNKLMLGQASCIGPNVV